MLWEFVSNNWGEKLDGTSSRTILEENLKDANDLRLSQMLAQGGSKEKHATLIRLFFIYKNVLSFYFIIMHFLVLAQKLNEIQDS